MSAVIIVYTGAGTAPAWSLKRIHAGLRTKLEQRLPE